MSLGGWWSTKRCILPVGNIGGLAQALQEALANRDSCRLMRQNSLKVIQHWGLDEEVQGLQKALKATLSST